MEAKPYLALLRPVSDGPRRPASPTPLEVVDSAVVRMAVYCDSWPGSWEIFVLGPLKAVIEQCPQLRNCDQLGCSCLGWHGLSGPRDPEAILEVWRRQFTTLQFRQRPTDKSEVFTACLRTPAALLDKLLKAAGQAGVFFETRDDGAKQVSKRHSVKRVPKAGLQKAGLQELHCTARLGVRWMSADAEPSKIGGGGAVTLCLRLRFWICSAMAHVWRHKNPSCVLLPGQLLSVHRIAWACSRPS